MTDVNEFHKKDRENFPEHADWVEVEQLSYNPTPHTRKIVLQFDQIEFLQYPCDGDKHHWIHLKSGKKIRVFDFELERLEEFIKLRTYVLERGL